MFKTIGFSLLSAYLYGVTSVIAKLLEVFENTVETSTVFTVYFVTILLYLLLPMMLLDYTNRILFAVLVTSLSIVISILMLALYKFDFSSSDINFMHLSECITVIFTSFGFQIVSHSLTNYCNQDAKMFKKGIFLW